MSYGVRKEQVRYRCDHKCVRVYDLKSNGRYIFFMNSTEAVAQRCSLKKLLLEISQNSYENTRVIVSFLIKLQASTCNFIKKETLAQVFPCEFCKIFKNAYFYRTPLMAASDSSIKLQFSSQEFKFKAIFTFTKNVRTMFL